MVRISKLDEYGPQIVGAINELFKSCQNKMVHFGELLVCQQNGFIFANAPVIGPGEEGGEYFPRLNTITHKGIGEMTSDDDYIKTNANKFFDGTSEFELSIVQELKKYQDIWENGYFIRLLIQLIHLSNGEHYDWQLNIKKSNKKKSSLIEQDVIEKSKQMPLFNELISQTYNRQLRNAIAHSQYQLIQGGILLNNVPPKDGKYTAFSFEQWERMYIQSYLLVVYIMEGLKQNSLKYFELSKNNHEGGIPIIVPYKDKIWRETLLYPDKEGRVWRFVKTY